MLKNQFCRCGCGRPTYVLLPKRRRKYHSVWNRTHHRIVAEKALGRPLPDGAEVHHINGNGFDNRAKNLVICQDSAYHKLLHIRMRVRNAGGDPNTERICSHCKCFYYFAQTPKWAIRMRSCNWCIRQWRKVHSKAHRERQKHQRAEAVAI